MTLSKTSQSFTKMAGKISFSDFLLLKYQYILYSLFFIFKTVVAFLGYQLVVNIPMYVSLRKLLTGMTFVYQYFFKKKKISNLNILEVILLTAGAILTGLDDYSTDIKGYIAVFLKNMTGKENICTVNIDSQNYLFHYKIDENVVYLVIADKKYPPKLAFCFIKEINDGFNEELKNQFGTQSVSYYSK